MYLSTALCVLSTFACRLFSLLQAADCVILRYTSRYCQNIAEYLRKQSLANARIQMQYTESTNLVKNHVKMTMKQRISFRN